jgi:hypothetical protein
MSLLDRSVTRGRESPAGGPVPDRPTDDAPLPPEGDGERLRRAVDAAVVVACAGFVFWQVHPHLVLADTTPAGGDMGAHVWALGYLRDVLLPSGRLSGWTPDWYAGFPVFHFYMVVPFLAMVLLNLGLGGVASVAPALVSVGLSARAVGEIPPRTVARGLGALAVVAVVIGSVSGFGPTFRFVSLAGALGAAVVAGRSGRSPRRWWWAAAAMVVAVVGIGLPYGVAFKAVTVSGIVAMPVAAYVFGRGAGLPHPTPPLLAVATLGFLFDESFTIYGGNVASTMAGEFAFSISLSLAIAYLGVVAHGLRKGTHRATAAVLLALVGLCHLIPAFFALAGTAALLVVHVAGERASDERAAGSGHATALAGVAVLAGGVVAVLAGLAEPGPAIAVSAVSLAVVGIVHLTSLDPVEGRRVTGRRRARAYWVVSTGFVAALLSAWWVLPFFVRRTLLNDMGWEKKAVRADGTGIWDWFTGSVWPELVTTDLRLVAAVALVGAVLSLAFRDRVGSALVILGLVLATAFVFAPQGRLWNARLLPFWYLIVYFLAAVGAGEVVRALAQVFSRRPETAIRRVGLAVGPAALVVVAVFLGGQLHNLPTGRENPDGSYRLLSSVELPGVGSFDLPDSIGVDVEGRNFVTDWARWNFSGYERKDAYPEYRAVVRTMEDLGDRRGCGMSLWEYSSDLNDYGTPMALMLLPHWTDGCIGSMEGLYFEASSTTPFHFLMQSELSASPSRAQRDLPYRELDIAAGVEHMQLMGVRYYLARSPEAVEAASAHDDLTEVAASGPWVVFEVAEAARIEPLTHLPAVTTAAESQDEWLGCQEGEEPCPGVALEWFQDPSRWDVALAASGPAKWQRTDPGEQPERRPVAPTEVDDVEIGRGEISFTVDRPGTPVLVKQSYFPNWEVSGAEGPYRVAPNLMVVVPTDQEVTMSYGRTEVELASAALTGVGLVLLLVLARAAPVVLPGEPGGRRPGGTERRM